MKKKRIEEFTFPIAEEIQFSDFRVVRFSSSTEYINNENVVAIDKDGFITWQIPKREYVYENSPYMKITHEGKNIVAHNWDGINLVLRAENGTIIEIRYSK